MVFDLPCYFLWSYKGIKTYIHEYGDVLSLVLIYNMIIYTILLISHKFLQITLCTESKCISNTFYIYSFFFNFCIFCCCCSVAKSCLTLCDSMDCNDSGFSVPHHLPKFAQVHVHCISDALHPSPLMPSTPSALNLFYHQRLFQWVSCLHQMIKILDLQLQHQSFQWVFRVDFPKDWLVWSPCCPRDSQESSQHHSSRASILWCSTFFTVQLSQPYVTTGKTITLTIWTFVNRVMFLLFNTLSRVVIASLPRSSHLLISWQQSPSAVILEPKKRKSITAPTFPPSICHDFSFF